ncbi:cyclin-domain-containing protein [Trichodelitschia bisporula]|uniref:Cyclin-domain-containing protein n=1 Tax=Trichodelitschia bisporula TaxID=703511 RepID=A0A6G1HQH2_9PEZI|nr:cyclin-domain-containing protein [Trichodelitschia bisporula]
MDTDGAAPPPAVDSEPFPARAETLLNRTPATPSGVVNRATEIPDVSSNKRARAEDPAMKVMPVDYTKCDVRDLGVVIADMLMELVRINDPLPFQNDKLTRFHSRAPPGISVHDYLNRLIVHATLSAPILLSMVYYIDRLCALYPQFTISSLTVHRFLIASATVAAKGLSDSFWTNSTYARVGGITLKELALLELDFLDKMQWKIVPDPQVLEDYYRSLVERNDGFALSREGSVEKE